MDAGFTAFKLKVGKNLYEDIKRIEFVRNIIGWERTLVSSMNFPISIQFFIKEATDISSKNI